MIRTINKLLLLTFVIAIGVLFTSTLLADDDRRNKNDSRWDRNERIEKSKAVTLTGRVRDVDQKKGRIGLDSNRGRITVVTERHTDIREGSRKRNVKDIRKGDHLVVTGRTGSRSTITANTIKINGSDSRNDRSYRAALTGEVTRSTSRWNRKLTVRTPRGEVSVEVKRDAKVIRNGRSISVHDINTGETIRATGIWQGNSYTAERVDVTASRRSTRYRP